MKKLFLGLFGMVLLVSCINDDDNPTPTPNTDYFAVANRGGGTITIYNADTQVKTTTISLEDTNASPSYVTYSSKRDVFYVADFNNQKVVAYSAETLLKVGEYTTEMGSFHMWLNDTSDQLWVNNIVSKTTSVIDLNTGNILQTLNLPNTITIDSDTAQHDVVISPNGMFAYVSVFSQTNTNYVLQYNTSDFSLMNSIVVGGDPHLTVTQNNLYILSQDDATIIEYNFSDLSATGNSGTMTNAHGVTVGNNNDIYITNILDRKVGSYNINNQTTTNITDAGSTSGVAHNLAYNPNSNILALTLSGSTTVDFFSADGNTITYLSSDNSGENPFGIVYMDR